MPRSLFLPPRAVPPMPSDVLGRAAEEARRTQVLVFAGGLGKRMGFVPKPKALLEVAGKPLIDWCIEYFAGCGFREFVLLVGKGADEVMRHVGDGGRYGVEVRYSVDPPLPAVGKGKALKHALEEGVVDAGRRALIAFPDDLFLDESLPLRLLLHHLEGVGRGALATAVFAWGLEYPYGVAELDGDGRVRRFVEKPVVDFYTSTGLYVFEPQVYGLVLELVDMGSPKPVEFEQVVLPVLAERGQLYSMVVPRGTWLPVNTLKELELAEEALARRARR